MSSVEPLIRDRRYRAPENNGEKYFDPPFVDAHRLLESNLALWRTYAMSWCDLSASQAMDEARKELLSLARDYTGQYRDVELDSHSTWCARPVLLTGHQPELSHPGVWYKNFVVGQLGQSLGGTAINLVTDNDATAMATTRVPAGSLAAPRIETVPYDATTEEMPFEERRIVDENLFAGFGRRVEELLLPFGFTPLIKSWWPEAIAAARRETNLGRCLAQARHRLEGEWGNQTLEVPFGRVCDTNSFRRFAAQLLDDLPRLHETYNAALLEYRRVNHIRSRTHPVPELQREDDWLEAPFWLWTAAFPRRKRLFARQVASGVEVTDRGNLRFTLASARRGNGAAAVEDLAAIASQGVKLRPRALLTTMFARLLLGDLFVHGIGGGKYDQLTDAIIRRYFGVEAPRFVVVTATAHLPIARSDVNHGALKRIDATLRELDFNPDRHVVLTEDTRNWIDEKQHWTKLELPRGARRERHLGIVRANRALQPLVAELREQLISHRKKVAAIVDHNKLVGSREFAFCLFPEETLRALLLDK